MPGLTLRLDRRAGPVGRIQRSSGTHDRRVFHEINQAITYLAGHGRWAPLEDVRDGRIRPIDLLQLWSAGQVRGECERELLVYVIRAKPSGNVKIGITDRLASRLAQLRSANFEELELVYAFPGTGKREREIHQYLRRSRIRGEWFAPTAEVLAWIELRRPIGDDSASQRGSSP